MSYIPPSEVISPKKVISRVRVLIDEGEQGYALAALRWDGDERIGLRWNGTADNPIGNPQSRGIPTWFLLPESIADLVTSSMPCDLDYPPSITRVRVRPLPKRIEAGDLLKPRDDQWILATTGEGTWEINNLATGHRIVLRRQHVKQLLPDTAADTPNGPKHGLLQLSVQIVFEDGEARLELGHLLRERVFNLTAELRGNRSAAHHTAVRTLIEEARYDLRNPNGMLGAWERECLSYAEAAVDANFPRLALAYVDKAIIVNGLSPAEYQHGFNYVKRGVEG